MKITIDKAVIEQALEAIKLYFSSISFSEQDYAEGYLLESRKALCQAIEQAEQAQPVAWVDLLKEAEEIVRGKFLWKRFIDGTPLANDIAVWMTDFALAHTAPPQRQPWIGLTDTERNKIVDANTTDDHGYDIWCDGDGVAKDIEAQLRSKNT